MEIKKQIALIKNSFGSVHTYDLGIRCEDWPYDKHMTALIRAIKHVMIKEHNATEFGNTLVTDSVVVEYAEILSSTPLTVWISGMDREEHDRMVAEFNTLLVNVLAEI